MPDVPVQPLKLLLPTDDAVERLAQLIGMAAAARLKAHVKRPDALGSAGRGRKPDETIIPHN